MDFRNLEGRGRGPAFRFSLEHLLLAFVWLSVVVALHRYPYYAAGVGGLTLVAYLHHQSLGRTSPIAAFAFVGSWAIAAVVGGASTLRAALRGSESVQSITNEDLKHFFIATLCIGLAVGGLAAAIAAIDKRDEWFNHLR